MFKGGVLVAFNEDKAELYGLRDLYERWAKSYGVDLSRPIKVIGYGLGKNLLADLFGNSAGLPYHKAIFNSDIFDELPLKNANLNGYL